MAAEDARGVYGLRLTGADLGAAVPPGAPASWPLVTIAVEPAPATLPAARHDTAGAVLHLADEERTLVADPAAGTATFLGPPLPPDELAHPYLGPVATLFARWHGHEAFHAAAFVEGGRAFAILGGKEAGKSTLVAAMAAAGVPIVADDMLVVHGRAAEVMVCRGPRTIDLRAEPGPALHGGAPVTLARGGERWRVALPEIAPAVPLAGWIFLEAASSDAAFSARSVPPVDRLQRLAAWRAWRLQPSDAAQMLALAALPTWDVRAPRRWEALPATIAALRTIVA